MILTRLSMLIALPIVVALSAAGCGKGADPAAPSPTAPTAAAADPVVAKVEEGPKLNVVQREMRSLETAMHSILTDIANNQLAPIPNKLFAIHEFRDATEKELHEGRYHPPTDSAAVTEFIAADEAFHDDLVTLVKASRANDLKAATEAYGVILNGCTSCHSRFRFGLTTP